MNDKKYGIGLATAVRGLSRYFVKGNDCKIQSTALYWYPLVGALLAILAVLPIIIINLIVFNSIYCLNSDAKFLESAIFVSLLAYGSRGFHLDGLADTFDGFGGGYTKDKIMEIMKDSRVGSFGATSLICLLLLKTVALSTVIENNILLVIAIVMVSRASLTLQCFISHYAKDYGLAKELCDNTKLSHLLVNFLFLLIPFYFLYAAGSLNIAIALLISMIVTTIVINRISLKKLGGITGDILGCTAEVVEMICSITIAFMLLA
jgi:adenosylcobinamide-GDP ribazoletransferase